MRYTAGMTHLPFAIDAGECLAGSQPTGCAGTFDQTLLAGFSAEWARRNAALPVRVDGDPTLLVARDDFLGALQEVQLATAASLRPLRISPGALERLVALAFGDDTSPSPVSPAPSNGEPPPAAPAFPPSPAGPSAPDHAIPDILAATEGAPVSQALNAILADAVRRRASDIHFEPAPDGLRVRLRIDGGLYAQPSPPRDLADAMVSRIKVLARMDIAERRLPQDGMAQISAGGRVIDLRVSTVPVADGERVVMRLLDRDNAWLPLDALGMGETVRAPFAELLARPHGLVVVSGPTGSGKTTTLYAALATLDASRRNILTVEDPVEYRLPAIGQIQVKPKIGLTFAAGLRHILRQDPDVILVGETRDPETAEIAVRAALTGHLVFTTLHTNDAPSAVARLVDMGVEGYLLASCLRGVLAQRLVRRLCPVCSRPLSPDKARARHTAPHLARLLDDLPPAADLRTPVGCDKCLEGYRGRIGLFEFMAVGDTVADTIRRGGIDAATLRDAASAAGSFHSLREDAIAKVAAGIADLAEAAATLQN